MKKCRGTYAYIAPEVPFTHPPVFSNLSLRNISFFESIDFFLNRIQVYGGKGFLPQSDVYSISIMVWEFVARILGGEYEKPYSEYPHIKMEVQILVQAARLNLRPKIKV